MYKTFIPFLLCLVPLAAIAQPNDCATQTTVPDGKLSLEQVVELGLCRNPQTAAAYLNATIARFNKNAGYANYLPKMDVSASVSKPYRNKNWDDWSYGTTVSVSYLIFDFGKRLADLNQLTAVWRATGFEYDETVQNYVFSIIGAYYELLYSYADVDSSQFARDVAKTAYDTATKKFKAGAVARADVLKAETTLASRDLDLERAKNNREIARGTLLTRLSFPADQNIDIQNMPSEFGDASENKNIDELIEIAQTRRPDLLRASANKDAAWHRKNSALLKNLPSISATGSVSWNQDPQFEYYSGHDHINGTIGIRASMPLFAGFSNLYGFRAAQASYQAATEQERAVQDNATLDIFKAYQNYKTAQKVLAQTKTLLASARESQRVTAGMYKVGRATMLDWQTAQSELVDAQKQNNAAKYDLFVKRAAVALAVGDIHVQLSQGETINE